MSNSFATPWTVACQAPLFLLGIFQARTLERIVNFFSRGSSGLRDWTHLSWSPALAGRFFTTESSGKPFITLFTHKFPNHSWPIRPRHWSSKVSQEGEGIYKAWLCTWGVHILLHLSQPAALRTVDYYSCINKESPHITVFIKLVKDLYFCVLKSNFLVPSCISDCSVGTSLNLLPCTFTLIMSEAELTTPRLVFLPFSSLTQQTATWVSSTS